MLFESSFDDFKKPKAKGVFTKSWEQMSSCKLARKTESEQSRRVQIMMVTQTLDCVWRIISIVGNQW